MVSAKKNQKLLLLEIVALIQNYLKVFTFLHLIRQESINNLFQNYKSFENAICIKISVKPQKIPPKFFKSKIIQIP